MTVPGNIPVPDPSALSTAALHREILHLRDLVDHRDAALGDRLEAVDKRLSEKLEADIRALYAEINNREKSVALALSSAQTAVDKAENAADKRFHSVNEFRAQLADQVSQFIPREVFETAITDIRNRVDRNTDLVTLNAGRDAGIDATRERASKMTSMFIAVVSVGVAIVSVVIVLVGK